MIRNFNFIKTWLVRYTNENQISAVLTNIGFSVFTDYTTRRAKFAGIRVELQEPEFELSG